MIRLYVDYDGTSGLPQISTLSGSLTAYSPAGETTLMPIESITPRRATSIDRGSRRHTLNFLLGDTQSLGELTILATVFDASDPTQLSAPFEQTLRFEQQPALRVLAVGIDYTGSDVKDDADPADLTAPTQADFVDTLEFTDRIFPIPSVMLTDYRTMEYDGDITSDISEGCDEFGDLKDAVADFVGDSDDVVYGLIGTGVDTGSVGGCGGGGAWGRHRLPRRDGCPRDRSRPRAPARALRQRHPLRDTAQHRRQLPVLQRLRLGLHR